MFIYLYTVKILNTTLQCYSNRNAKECSKPYRQSKYNHLINQIKYKLRLSLQLFHLKIPSG